MWVFAELVHDELLLKVTLRKVVLHQHNRLLAVALGKLQHLAFDCLLHGNQWWIWIGVFSVRVILHRIASTDGCVRLRIARRPFITVIIVTVFLLLFFLLLEEAIFSLPINLFLLELV